MSKNVFIVFSDYPFGTNKVSEKLRLAVGLTLNDDNILSLIFLGHSIYALQELNETKANMKPISKHIEMLAELDIQFYVVDGDNFSISNNLKYQSIHANEFNDFLDSADVIIH